jgi:hypothetical protein
VCVCVCADCNGENTSRDLREKSRNHLDIVNGEDYI